MKKRLENFITGTSFQPWPGYAFTHIQEAHQEIFDALMKGQVGLNYDPTKAYIIYGCVPTVFFTHTDITEGAIFFNGEVYLSPAQTVVAGAGVILANILTTYADPAGQTVYTDTTINRDCQINTCAFFRGTSGTGTIGDFSTFLSFEFVGTGIVLASGWTSTGSPYYDLAYKVEGNEVTLCGQVRTSSLLASSNLMFTLPAIARPTKTVLINTTLAAATPEDTPIIISNNGQAVVLSAQTGNCIVYLDNVKFRKY